MSNTESELTKLFKELEQPETPRIYAACLCAYNNSRLHGEWIDCDRDSDEIMADIKAMLSRSLRDDFRRSPMAKVEVCEEWAIHDYEGFHGISISEHESIDLIVELAQQLEEHGEAMAAYLEHYSFEDREHPTFYLAIAD
jgi:antirestriction protein